MYTSHFHQKMTSSSGPKVRISNLTYILHLCYCYKKKKSFLVDLKNKYVFYTS